jgi:transcriptional regulator with XRE-family HTH domain
MSFVNKNLRHLRQQLGWTQKELADKLKVKQPVIGAYEEERAVPPLFTLTRIAELFAVSLDALVQSDLSKPAPIKKGTAKKEVLAITVDGNDKENIELVVQKAAAGYLAGYQDPEFVGDLPKISMPVLPRNRTHRAFEIQGDSMLPVLPGTIVFGEYVENLNDLKNGKLYILVTKNDGIVFKRAFMFKQHAGNLLCVSDNQKYHPYILPAEDVLELWQASAFFSKDFPEKETAYSPLTDKLALLYLSDKMK